MKLEQFDIRNCTKDYTQKRATISITSNNRISFNKKACAILGIKEGSKVLFYQEDEKKDNWYIRLSDDENAFKFKKNPKHGYHLNNTTLSRKIKESIEAKSYCKFIMSPHEDSSLYAIITHSKK